jgi:hypothetical protein
MSVTQNHKKEIERFEDEISALSKRLVAQQELIQV